jgi:LysR family transcriptional regulator, nitrogen assimilation regulatory protein
MDLRALRYFVHIAEARSFSRAAAQLRVAQPALSRQMQKLEGELGTVLLLRTRRQLELTDAGHLMLQRAHSLLRQIAQTADDVRAQGTRVQGTMTVGVSPAIGEGLVPKIFSECGDRHPDLRLNVVEGFSSFIFKRLIDQEITLCLMHNPPRHRGIEIEPLQTEAMCLIGPGAGAGRLPPAKAGMRLDEVRLILPNRTHNLRMLIERAIAADNGSLGETMEVDGYTTTKALILAGLGYTILPLSSVRHEVENGMFQPSRSGDRRCRGRSALRTGATSEIPGLFRRCATLSQARSASWRTLYTAAARRPLAAATDIDDFLH